LTFRKNRVRLALSELYCQQSQQNALTDHNTQLPNSFRLWDAADAGLCDIPSNNVQ